MQYSLDQNYSGLTSTLGPSVRWMDQYDELTKEVGLEAALQLDFSPFSAVDPNNTELTNLYKAPVFTTLFVHSWHLSTDSQGNSRSSVSGAIGGSFGTGYLGGLVRASHEWRFASHFALSTHLGFRPSSTTASGVTLSGVNFGLTVHYVF